MSSYTYSQTFTETHAKHLSAKVATDLKRMQRFYGAPSNSQIEEFEKEIIQYLKNGYLEDITYGFKKDDRWIEPTLKYTAKELANDGIDDDPGKIRIGADINGADFYSYLRSSQKYFDSSQEEREIFHKSIPIQRYGADYPSTNGYFSSDRSYYSGGKGLNRSSLKGL